MKKILLLLLAIVSINVLAACGSNDSSKDEGSTGEGTKESQTITFGATSGPYSDMVTKAVGPLLEEKGYEVKNIEFSDYVQPNKSLANGDLDANLFQHKIYLESFAEANGLDLSEVVIVPTAPMGLYSSEFDSVEAIEDGSTITIPNDPSNLARALIMLQDQGLITIGEDVNPLVASVGDIQENPKNLKFKEIEAGQLPRTVESVDVATVPGNYALAADMDLMDALVLENMPDDYRNRIVVKTEDLNKQFVKDIEEVVRSAEFEKIIDEQFQGFGKPQWMLEE